MRTNKEAHKIENPDEYEQQIEESVETQREANEEYDEDNSPSPTNVEDLYSLFWKVIQIKDSSKVGNLDKQELGNLDMNVRDCQAIALLCDEVGYTEVARWLREKSQITLRTSSSKKGWLPELFVSAKKFSSKEKRLGLPNELPVEQKKGGFFSRFKR